VSFDNEILHMNDSYEIENETNKM